MLWKAIKVLIISWLLFALVAAIAPYAIKKTVSEEKKKELEQIQYYGDGKAGSDRALVVESPTDALNIRMEILRNTKKKLDIVTHAVRDSESTRAFFGEVLAAADRGVKVRLLVDGLGAMDSGTRGMLKALDAHPAISCRVYNPLNPLTPWRWNALLHDKFIIADDHLLLLGGRNVDQRHYGSSSHDKPITHDRDVFIWQAGSDSVENPGAARQSATYMDALWEYDLTQPIVKRKMKSGKAQLHWDTLRTAKAKFESSDPQFYVKTLADYQGETVETNRVTLLYNPIEVGKKEPWLAWQLQQLVLDAQEQVTVQTPYATGNLELLRTMAEVAKRAELVVITNSAVSTPNFPAYSNYYGQREKFLDTGARLFEYQNKDSIHGKSLVIDGRLSAVGSLNMDDRSFYLDTETMLLIDSPQFAQQLGGVMKDIKEQSLELGAGLEYLPSQMVDALEPPKGKLFVMRVFYIVMRPFQFLL